MVFFIDLDGTLLSSENKISEKNLQALHTIKNNNGTVVIVTGRNKFSTQKVLDKSLPIDFLIYSTGIAISDFRNDNILKKYYFSELMTKKISSFLMKLDLNFFVHQPAPDNHFFYYHYVNYNADFDKRLKIYSETGKKLSLKYFPFYASQFVIILPNDVSAFVEIKNKISSKFPELSYIRATSPLDNEHIWLEIYPKNVSKGFAVLELCKIKNIDLQKTIAIGNDYNDISMLDIAAYSFVTANSPTELHNKYRVIAHHNNDALVDVVNMFYQ
jgi:Cof subfamily protein (haloacid dehalogenase superfamily)